MFYLDCPRSDGIKPSLHEQVICWSRKWVIMGEFVACSECLGFQSVEHSGQPFLHMVECSLRAGESSYPWALLNEVLNKVLVPFNSRQRQ